MFDPLLERLKRSVTLDGGSEVVNHKQVGIKTYFADPYSSWQIGGGVYDNANLWIRYYFTKQTDLRKVSEEEIQETNIISL